IRDALSGKTTTGIKKLPRGLLLTASSPIYYDQGQLIGTITTGIFMDDSFVKRIRNLSGAEIGITDSEGTLLASSLPALKTSGLRPAQGREILQIAGNRYILMRMPIKGNDTTPSGELLVMTEDKLPEIIKNAHLTVTFVLVFIAVLSIVATGLIIRRVLKPVHALERGAERIGTGDFRQRIDVQSGDEIGKLADAFNKMAENLEKLREMEERLSHAERLASIGRFTAGIAHEMNNPIANIIGLLKITRREITDESTREDIDIAIKEAMRCGAIVRDLLLYSRQSPPNKEPLNINSLVEEVIKTIEQSQDLTGIEIIRLPGNGLPTIHGDPIQLEQVVRNLILNAIQAVEDEGTITIETTTEGKNILIKVTDTGKGMDE
ncbi:MAG: HAMP domain-containing protein, partial [Nitrospirae bacterium]